MALARQLESLWRQLPNGPRVALVLVAGLAVIVVLWSTSQARTGDYVVAFTNLADEEVAAIATKLKENKIPFELGDRGTIRVPSSQMQEVRLLAASQGLGSRSSGVGFELFNQPHFGFTEFAEKVNYQRALEGEIGRTIARLDGIENARVHLVIPQQRLFTSTQQATTASVVLQLKAGRRLDQTQVQSIVQLVANSVEGLKSENVGIVDGTGTVLTDRSSATDPARHTDRRGELQRAAEGRIEADVKSMLTRLLGPDKSVVRVTMDLDWDQYEANSETFSPTNKPPQIRSQREVTESTRGAGAMGGVPGSDSNTPTYPSQPASESLNEGQRTEKSTNFELSKTVEKLVRAPGAVKRISVAAAVDSTIIGDVEQFDAISRLIATAAGLDVNRGDLVTLTSLPFAPTPTQPEVPTAEWAQRAEAILTGVRIGTMVLGPLIMLLLIRLILRGKSSPRAPLVLPLAPMEDRLERSDPVRALPNRTRDPESLPQTRMHEEVQAFARAEPAAVAQIVRTWLREDQAVQ
jgi:flagellar M-ring protein FliF